MTKTYILVRRYFVAITFFFYFRHLLEVSCKSFNGRYDNQGQDSSVSRLLKALIAMVLRGANADIEKNPYFDKITLTISQLMLFKLTLQTHETSFQLFHSTSPEPSLAVYFSQLLHSRKRKLNLVQKIFHLGLCISPDRLLDILTIMRNK